MKKGRLLLTILLLLLLLVSCGKTPSDSVPFESLGAVDSDPYSAEKQLPPPGELFSPLSFLPSAYDTGLSADSFLSAHVSADGKVLIALSENGDVFSLDLASGECRRVFSVEIEDMAFAFVGILKDQLVFRGNEDFRLYSMEGEPVFTIPCDSFIADACIADEKLWFVLEEDASLCMIDGEKPKTEIVRQKVPQISFLSSLCGVTGSGVLAFEGLNEEESYVQFLWRCGSEEIRFVNSGGGLFIDGDRALLLENGSVNICGEEDGVLQSFSLSGENEWGVICRNGWLLTTEYREEALLYAYRTADGQEVTGGIHLGERNGYWMALSESYGFFLYYDEDEKSHIALYDFTAFQKPDGSFYAPLANPREKNDRLASKIQSEFGVQVFLRNDVVRYFPSYVVVPELDEGKIGDGLEFLYSVLSRFPNGFFEELHGDGSHREDVSYDCIDSIDYIDRIEIYLTGSIRQSFAYEGVPSIGFKTFLDGEMMLVIDIDQDAGALEETMAHELFHMIEDRILWNNEQAMDEWEDFLPEDVTYSFSYEEYGELSDSYTALAEDAVQHPEGVYFVDSYSKTFPHEDRARIFERLFAGDELPWYFQSEHIRRKAEFLCRILRENFSSAAALEETYWERKLASLPLTVSGS